MPKYNCLSKNLATRLFIRFGPDDAVYLLDFLVRAMVVWLVGFDVVRCIGRRNLVYIEWLVIEVLTVDGSPFAIKDYDCGIFQYLCFVLFFVDNLRMIDTIVVVIRCC